MRSTLLKVLAITFAASTTVLASDRPESFDFEFKYVSDGTAIPDNNVLAFLLSGPTFFNGTGPADQIQYLELEVNGLVHDAPWDLNMILIDPTGLKPGQLGSGVTVMEDAGYFGPGFELDDTTLLFADKGVGLPTTQGDGALQNWPDTIYAPMGPGSFSQYNGSAVGNSPWVFVITDDAVGNVGSFDSVILRGVVPEPATLSLLLLGAFATFRRRK